MSLLRMFFYPLFLFMRTMRQTKRRILARVLQGVAIILFLFPLWLLFDALIVFAIYRGVSAVSIQTGLIPVSVSIAGTGSMYPTFPKGKSTSLLEQESEEVAAPSMKAYPGGIALFGRRFFGYTLKRKDIISFSNAVTQDLLEHTSTSSAFPLTGFVKRVIALPGDMLEIRDGFVYLNGQPLKEPYTASPRSTFGGSFLSDCAQITIPEGKVFVLGDNRKGSMDSRHTIGLVDMQDIRYVLPLIAQGPYETGWHDPSNDAAQANKPTLNPQEYLTLLNNIRKEHKLSPLKYQEKLARSAALRANTMLRYDDLSFEATRSGYTMAKAMRDVGYSNIVYGEAPTLGYYTAEELLENYAQFPEWERFLLDKQYQETGIAVINGVIRGCPTQVIVQHVAGYVPPNYKPEDIASWKAVLDNLQSVLPSWESVRDSGALYEEHKQEFNRMIEILRQRIAIVQSIYNKMNANQWLNDADQAQIETDKNLAREGEELAKKLQNL